MQTANATVGFVGQTSQDGLADMLGALNNLSRLKGERRLAGGWMASLPWWAEAERWLFGLVCVGNQPGNRIYHKVRRTSMACVLNLGDVFQLVIDGFD